MILVCAYFPERPEYKDLRKIFFMSAQKAMPGAKVHFIQRPAIGRNKPDHHLDTYLGFKLAAEYVLHLNKPCAICDVDLMFRKSIADIWDRDFDIAVTTRDHHAKYNTGLWFFRPTEEARFFVKRWIELTEKFALNMESSSQGLKKWAGLDQYSLACTAAADKHVNLIELPCQEWNAEQTCWDKITEQTRVIHLKSQLRNELFGRDQRTKYDGTVSERLKVFPECKMLAKEARSYL